MIIAHRERRQDGIIERKKFIIFAFISQLKRNSFFIRQQNQQLWQHVICIVINQFELREKNSGYEFDKQMR